MMMMMGARRMEETSGIWMIIYIYIYVVVVFDNERIGYGVKPESRLLGWNGGVGGESVEGGGDDDAGARTRHGCVLRKRGGGPCAWRALSD